MFWEPGQFPDNYGWILGRVNEIGFTELPGGNQYKNIQVLNDHTYCC